jgi:hypothetical protein
MAHKTKPAKDNKAGGDVGKTQPLTAESIENTIRYFSENGKLWLIARFEGLGNHSCKLDSTWSVQGVTFTDSELSFVASQGEKKPIKFYITLEAFIKSAARWFQEMAATLTHKATGLVEAIIPPTIIFNAGVTEYVGRKPSKA